MPDFRAELLTFARGRYDDQVDALALIGQLIDVMRKGKPLAKPGFPKLRTMQDLTMDEAWELCAYRPKDNWRI